MGPSRKHVRRASIALSAPVAWLLAMTSIAYACTLTGPSIRATQVVPDSGGPNTSIIASATGMAARTLYRLEMIDSAVRQGKQCGYGGEISAPVESDPLGDVAPTAATIPETVATGLAEISWVAVATATDRSPVFLFTVLGGESCGQVLYRAGSGTNMSFTPRVTADTTGWPQNGLSTYTVKAKACREQTRVQVLERTRLPGDPGLQLVADSGDATHIFITPTTGAGGQARLDQWAATRLNAELDPDPFTTAVKNARVGQENCP